LNENACVNASDYMKMHARIHESLFSCMDECMRLFFYGWECLYKCIRVYEMHVRMHETFEYHECARDSIFLFAVLTFRISKNVYAKDGAW